MIYSSVENAKVLLKIIREVKEYLLDHKHKLKIRNKEQIDANIKIITSLISGLIKGIKTFIKGTP